MITVNGNGCEWKEGMTVTDVLRACNYSFPLIIVSVNGKHIDKSIYGTYRIPDGADVAVVHLMSGG